MSEEKGNQTPEQIDRENDHDALSAWAHDISEVIEAAPKGVAGDNSRAAVALAREQLEGIHGHLISKASRLIGE